MPKVYTENIALHHQHKFLKERTNDKNGLYGNNDGTKIVMEGKYEPPLPNSIIKEENCKYDVNKNAYGGGKEGRIKISKAKREHEVRYEPPLPNSVIKEDTGVYNECDHSSSKKLIRDTKNYKNESVLYGEIDRPDIRKIGRKGDESIYEPPLPNSILEVKSQKGKHATQKPVALMEWILKYYSREGGVVLDPTMGSGSMGVACEKQNRLFIGVEKDEKIYNVALERCGL